MNRRCRRAIRAFAVLVLAAVAGASAATAAGAQTSPTGAPSTTTADPTGPRITLASQDAWTPVGGETHFGLDVASAPPGATVSFTVYQGITSRKQYDAAALGGPLTSVLSQIGVPLDALALDETGLRSMTLGLQPPNDARDATRLNVRRPGVYPLEVELRDADEQTVASFRTMLVVSEADRATVAEPLAVAWVLPVSDVPSFLPDGSADRDVIAAFRPNGRLGRMGLALRDVPDVPVTLAPTAETIEAWSEQAHDDPSVESTFADLQAATAGRDVLDGPYVPVDLPALLDHGLGEAVDDVLTRGTQVLGPTLGTTVDARTRLLAPASASALGRLHIAGVDRVVVPAESLAPLGQETKFTLAQPVNLTAPISPTDSEPVAALVTDPGLQSILTSELPAAQRVQLLLAGLSVVALESPNVPHVVTLANPAGFDAPTELYRGLLQGLRNNPYLKPVTVTQAFDTVPADPPAVLANGAAGSSQRELSAVASATPPITAAEYRNQRNRLNSFGALTRPGDPAVGIADRSLLASVATGWPLDIGAVRADAHLGVVDEVIDELVSQIEVPDPRTITLTSRSGEIPLTFRNETGHPVHLRASLASEKLFFPQGTVLDLELPPKSTTVRVAVEARTSGTFPVDLEVTSADGVLSISQRRLEVRSTFVSTVGVVLMVSAVAFLALWWGFDLRRRRKRRRQPTTS